MAKCMKPGKYGPCRKCNPCLESRMRQWVFRMILEAMSYATDQVTFCTFTYRPECLPADEKSAKEQMQKFLKRLRKTFDLPGHIRYVAALEKGTMATRRYHWHAIIYGLRFTSHNRHIMEQSWGNGFIQWKPSTPGRMAYVLKYVIKGGKFLMSRNPGIGEYGIKLINNSIAQMTDYEIEKLLDKDEVMLFNKIFPPSPLPGSDVHVNKKTGEVKSASHLRSSTMSPGISEYKPGIKYMNVGGYPFGLHRFVRQRLMYLRRKKSES